MSSKNFEEKFISDGLSDKRVVVAFSGGADSVSLLHRLFELKEELGITLEAVHLNHCLRGEESEKDELFVREFCKNREIPLTVERKDISSLAKEKGISEETCGREERYKLFAKVSEGGLVATAHTLSDNLETVVFHMIRGTSLKGLCGIPQKRGNIVRPILDCTRKDVEDYCQRKGLEFVKDSTNESVEYSRNKIRKEIIPKFFEINSSADNAFMRMKNVLCREEEYLDKETTVIFGKMKKEDFSLKPLEEKDDIFVSRIAVKLLEEFNIPVDYQNVDRVADLFSGKSTRQQMCGNYFFKIIKNRIIFEEDVEVPYFEEEIPFENGEVKIKISESCEKNLKIIVTENNDFKKVYKNLLIFALDYDTINGKLVARQRKDGDKIKLFRRNGTKSLKKVFNEKKIPVPERQKLLLLCDDKDVVAVENIGVSQKCAVTEKTKKILLMLKNDN